MFCFDKHSAKQLKEKKVRRNSLPVYTCQHMKVIQLHLTVEKQLGQSITTSACTTPVAFFSVSSSLPAEQVLATLKCQVHFMNFTLRPIITITMLSKILGAFNAVFSYTGISLRSLVKEVGIIQHHRAYSLHEPPLLMSVCACLSVQYVNPRAE